MSGSVIFIIAILFGVAACLAIVCLSGGDRP